MDNSYAGDAEVIRECSECNLAKPSTEFYKSRKRKCKQCLREQQARYRERDDVKQREKEYRQRPDVVARDKSPERQNKPSQRKRWAESLYNRLHLAATDY